MRDQISTMSKITGDRMGAMTQPTALWIFSLESTVAAAFAITAIRASKNINFLSWQLTKRNLLRIMKLCNRLHLLKG